MANSPNLMLPYLEAAQAQKHVTHNEAIRSLDALVQLAVLNRTVASPPSSPADGDRYLVPSGATGAWAGKDFNIAAWQDGAWAFFAPREGWLAWIADEANLFVFDGSAWASFEAAAGFIRVAASTVVSRARDSQSENRMLVAEELLGGLSGAYAQSSIVIPNRAVVFGVSTRTVQAMSGAASYDCGIAGEPSKFGGSLGVAQGSTNAGVIGPTAFYADTPVRLTANGGSFSGGAVRIAIHYLQITPPQS
jgi:hypothetical protein